MPTAATHTENRVQQRLEASQHREAEARRQREQEIAATVEAVHQIRTDVDNAVAQLQEKANLLRKLARTSIDEGGSSLLVYANAHLRFAGAVNQGLRRASSMDRILDKVKRDREEAERREAENQKRLEARAAINEVNRLLAPPTDDDFDEVYGEIIGKGEVA